MNYQLGQKAKVSFNLLRKHCCLEPYINLVKAAQKNGEGFVEVVEIPEREGFLTVAGWRFDLLHYAEVPVDCLIF